MRREFEINGEYRIMEDEELVAILTNSEKIASKVKEEEVRYGDGCNLEHILNQMTPARRKVACAGIELYKRQAARKAQKPLIRCSEDIYQIMQPVIGDNPTEESWVLLVNQGGRLIRKARISTGGLSSTVVDVRCVLKEAILSNASCMVLCHNHPSGNNQPSREDDRITQKLKEAGAAVSIQLIDHLVICSNAYYSYADEGKL